MIPVWVLTGFLGSGKTTLLGRCLKHPAFARTAVIINEFGEIGLDHDLIETSEESFVTLRTGCLCCRVRDDLLLTLEDLLRRRVEGVLAPFERIIIETSGLADPGPILMALMTDQDIAGRIALAGVVTTVDAVHALATLDRHGEAIRQIAVADRLVVTKTDLVAAPGEQLTARLAALNPAAVVIAAAFGAVDAEELFAGRGGKQAADVERWLASTPAASQPAQPHQAIASVALVRETPMRAVALTLLLECLAEHCGSDLLRLKGLIQIAECPDRPAVVHGVGHVIEPPAWLERWPSADRRSRLVLIGRKLQAAWVEALATALEAEVAEVLAAGQA
ncbi:MAG TPA: GTP-binding protein [Hyphomicrobiaceae bacterium]|nr:GTP-binding protein [Hyphomicrobiaceae bacterium]